MHGQLRQIYTAPDTRVCIVQMSVEGSQLESSVETECLKSFKTEDIKTSDA